MKMSIWNIQDFLWRSISTNVRLLNSHSVKIESVSYFQCGGIYLYFGILFVFNLQISLPAYISQILKFRGSFNTWYGIKYLPLSCSDWGGDDMQRKSFKKIKHPINTRLFQSRNQSLSVYWWDRDRPNMLFFSRIPDIRWISSLFAGYLANP